MLVRCIQYGGEAILVRLSTSGKYLSSKRDMSQMLNEMPPVDSGG